MAIDVTIAEELKIKALNNLRLTNLFSPSRFIGLLREGEHALSHLPLLLRLLRSEGHQ